MSLGRKSVICLSACLFIIGIAIPLLAALYLSWIQALDIEQDKLYAALKLEIQRSRICLNEIYDSVDELEASKLPVCTPKHLQQMRNLVFSKRCINEIQYIQNSYPKCGSEGIVHSSVQLSDSGFEMPNATIISSDISNFVNKTTNSIRFNSTNYAVLVDKHPLTDLMTLPYIKIAVATESGQIISTKNYYAPDLELIQKVMADPDLDESDGSLITVARTPGLYYVISEPMSYVIQQWHKTLLLFLPFGLIMSLVAVTAIVWALRRRFSYLGELRIAVARREFLVHYQPIVDLKSGICIGAEALVRWKKPDGTMVRPDLFIPIAESNGLIQDITDQVVESVIKNLKRELNENRNLHISINVSVLDFNSKRIFKKLEEALAGTGIEPQQIWLEITERGFIDFGSARESLNRARELGYIIVIDDFGTGYSSLSYLKELHIDVLKIDKSFVSSVNTDSVTSNVTEHIINLAKELNLKTVAEGVETAEQARYLQLHNVDYAQGWLYAKAMPLDEFLDFCKKNAEIMGNKNE